MDDKCVSAFMKCGMCQMEAELAATAGRRVGKTLNKVRRKLGLL